MDIDIMNRQLAELNRLVPTLVTRMDALERALTTRMDAIESTQSTRLDAIDRTIGAQQRQVSDLTNLAPQRAAPKQPESAHAADDDEKMGKVAVKAVEEKLARADGPTSADSAPPKK